MWQEIIVGVCVLTATAFVLRRYVWMSKAAKQGGGCSSCKGCGSGGCKS